MQTAPAPANLPKGFTAPAGAVIDQGKGGYVVPKTASPIPTPTVVTSAPAAAAVQSAQSKLQVATTPPPVTTPVDNNPNPNPAPTPTPTKTPPTPAPKTGGAAPTTIPSGGYGYYKDPSSGAITYYDSNGNTLPTNPIGGDQYKNNPEATPGGGLVALSAPPGTQPTTNSDGTTSTPSLIPGTDIPSTGDPSMDALITKYQSGVDDFNTEIANINTQLDSMRANMDQANQTLLDQIGASFDSQVAAAQAVNQAQVAGMTQSGIRSGLSMYAPEIYTGNITKILNDGIAKVSDILSKKAQALAKAQQANAKEDYTSLYQEMQNYEKMQGQEQTQTLNLLKSVQANEKLVAQEQKDALAAQKTQQTIADTEAKDHAYAVLSALDSEAGSKGSSTLAQDQAMVQEYAALYGLDPQKLLSQVEQLKNTKDSYGSGVIGQYRFYADFETQQGRTPMTFEEYQAATAGAKAAATANASLPAKQKLKETPTGNSKGSANSGLSKTLAGIGLPLTVADSKGAITKAALQKVLAGGVSFDDANGIWANIAAGNSLEDIRQGMKSSGLDPAILDKFMTSLQN